MCDMIPPKADKVNNQTALGGFFLWPKGNIQQTGLTKQEKTTAIWFDEKEPIIHVRTHNTDLKNRLTKYSHRYPAICKLTDDDPEIGCKEFEIEKGRFSFRLTAPYNEERRQKASENAKQNGFNVQTMM